MHSNVIKYTLLSGANILFALVLYSLINGPAAKSPFLMYSMLISSISGCIYAIFLLTPDFDSSQMSSNEVARDGSRLYTAAR